MKKFTFLNLVTLTMLLFATTVGYGQYTHFSLDANLAEACTFDDNDCTTSSATISRVYLGTDDGTNITELTDCNVLDPLDDVYIYLDVASSTKEDIYFQFDLFKDGTQINYDGTTPYSGTVDQRISVGHKGDFDTGTYRVMPLPAYSCGEELTIENLFISWQVNDKSDPGCNNQSAMCNKDLVTETIIVTTPIFADFTAAASCQGDSFQEVLFTDSSSGGSSNNIYVWDFGDDASPATADTKGPHTVTYTTGGTKTVTLTVTDADNDTNEGVATNENVVVAACCVDLEAGDDNSTEFCEGSGATTNLTALLSVDADSGGQWAETSGVSSGVTIGAATSIDFSGVNPGNYTFTYTHSDEIDNACALDVATNV
jgi:hypothetical protein